MKVLDAQGLTVQFQCENGLEVLEYCRTNPVDIVLMDINMPIMDGFEATAKLAETSPSTRVIALSMYDDDISLVRMIRAGARSYVLKGASASELKNAILGVCQNGFHSSDMLSGRLIRNITGPGEGEIHTQLELLNHRELDFLRYACSEMTYKEIAEKMFVSHRSIDGYRDSLFQKLGVKSRVGLCIFAIKHKVVQL